MKKYYIRPIALVSDWQCDMSYFTYRMNFGIPLRTAYYVWYIEGSKPRTLVDAGCTADLFPARNNSSGERHVQTIEEGLGRIGLTAADIEQVIVTHLHFDHIALSRKYTNAKFIVQKTELDFAMNPHPFTAATYDKPFYESIDFKVIQGDTIILEGVKAIYTPGHSPGGQSVAVETSAGQAIITGFCCVKENFNPPLAAQNKGWIVAPSGPHVDALKAFDIALKIKQTADIIIPNHDMCFVNIERIPNE